MILTDRMQAAALPFHLKVHRDNPVQRTTELLIYRYTKEPRVFYARAFIVPCALSEFAENERNLIEAIRNQSDIFFDSLCRLAFYASQRWE